MAARSKLAEQIHRETNGAISVDTPSAFFKTYRDVRAQSDGEDEDEEDELDSENEVHDLYDEPSGGVNIVVYDK